jgi:tagatose-1,6-bisphosphate aldolase
VIAGLADPDGGIRAVAIDHRDSLRVLLSPEHPDAISAAEITAFKIDVVAVLARWASGVMLEPEYSVPQVPDAGVLPNGVGFTIALEDQGYLADPGGQPTRVMPGWSVAAAVASGAAAAKLLVPYRPGAVLASAQEDIARSVAAECVALDFPLVLEPLVYGVDDADEHAALVLETVGRFASMGAALLKLPFPGRGRAAPSLAAAACEQITELCPVPWALLSGGGSFESFEAQLIVARRAGCAGFMVGRALWGDVIRAPASDRRGLLTRIVAPRLKRLGDIVRGR